MSQTDMGVDRELSPNMPLWVKVLGIIVIVLILLFVTLHLTGLSPVSHRSHLTQGGQQP